MKLFQFVNSISESPGVRLDLNAGPLRVKSQGLDLSPAPVRRATTSTMVAHGDQISAAAFGNRSVKLPIQLDTASPDAAAAALNRLALELARDNNILRVQLGSRPFFFRTFFAPDYTWAMTKLAVEGGRAVLDIPAEPWAYGLPVELPAFTVHADPDAVVSLVSEDFEDTDFNITWTDGGNAPWARNTVDPAHGGTGSLRSGAITHAQTSDAVVDVPAGATRVRFWYRHDSEEWDRFRFLIGATEVLAVGGVGGVWTQSSPLAIPAGTNTVTFRYTKDGSVNSGADAVWVDDVEFFTPAENRTFFDVTDVRGDVPAATKIDTGSSTFFNVPGHMAIRRRGNPADVPYLFQAEAMIQLTDTATQPHDPAMSGAGRNYSRCTFATSTALSGRLFGETPPVDSVDARGTYRVFVRCRRSNTTDTINVQLNVGTADTSAGTVISTVATSKTTNVQYIDLGLMQVPFGLDPVHDGPSGIELPVGSHRTIFQINADRVGSGTIDFDLVLFVPADDQFLVIDVGNDSTASVIFDSHLDMGYAASSGAVDPAADIVPLGGMLEVAPGVVNRIYLRVGHLISGTDEITVTYWPRYLHVVGPVSP